MQDSRGTCIVIYICTVFCMVLYSLSFDSLQRDEYCWELQRVVTELKRRVSKYKYLCICNTVAFNMYLFTHVRST